MSKTETAMTGLIRQMRKAFFDVSPEGVLVYQDPFIGRLDSPRKGLIVELIPGAARLELKIQGKITARFDLTEGVGSACERACVAYFEAVRSLSAQRTPTAAAA
jgi:hypothetical protein